MDSLVLPRHAPFPCVQVAVCPLLSGELKRSSRSRRHPWPGTERGRSMGIWLHHVDRFLRSEDGPTAVEYAVMLALIIVVCITAITALGSGANKTFSNVSLNAAAGS
jgi:pilus assembly protein Flp/PilA